MAKRIISSRTGEPVSLGYTLSSEEHGPLELVEIAQRAEDAGFEFVSVSDHFHPWVTEQGHSPFVWSVLGAVASRTERLGIGVGVTCPIMRIHPAIIAQATATTALLSEGRFFFGVGTGEALNEHVIGRRWPTADVRLAMLEEAVAVIRELWSGETVSHRGEFYEVENARLFDAPDTPPPVIVSAFGPKAVRVAARIGDGYWGHTPDAEILERFEREGGKGPRYAQVKICWAKTEEEARQTVHRVWPNGGLSGQLSQDLPTWLHFEQAVKTVTPEDASSSIPCGPDPQPVIESLRTFVDAGYDHLYLHQVGPDQDGFFRFWADELQPAVAELVPVGR
ncbi:MAG TPA: TIGR03557 family F420-dependent LLM class oxidoreductase [Acidimicrobiales bacterium]|nr:TIGR03557 family F420-dependent LLM class oxidoreductase [Acidimicrobiales bacterium]